MNLRTIFSLVMVACTVNQVLAGQPTERFRSATQFTMSQGTADPRYGNLDSNVKITLDVFLLGTQVFNNPGNSPEAVYNKTAGSLDFTIKLSDFDPTLPPDTVTMVGTDLGNDLMSHNANSVLPGPYHVTGTINGTSYDLTLRNVLVTGNLQSQGSNSVTPPYINALLGGLCDVQFDDPAGSSNWISAVPGSVSGWVVSPVFTVRSMRVDTTGIQQAGQVPAHVVSPTLFRVILGRVDAGGLTEVQSLDGATLRVCKFFVPNSVVPPIRVEVVAQLSSLPQFLSGVSNSHMVTGGLYQQIMRLYDYTTGNWLSGDNRTDPINLNYELQYLQATGQISRYLDANNNISMRFEVKQVGPAAQPLWCSEMDFLGWVVTP